MYRNGCLLCYKKSIIGTFISNTFKLNLVFIVVVWYSIENKFTKEDKNG